MVTIIGLALLLLGITSTALQYKNILKRYSALFNLSFIGLIILLSSSYFLADSEANYDFPVYLIATLFLGGIVSLLSRKSSSMLWLLVIPVSSFAILFLPKNIEFLDYPLVDTQLILALALFGSLTPLLIHFTKVTLGYLIRKFGKIEWKEREEEFLDSALSFLFIGVITVIAGNLLSNFGILLVATCAAANYAVAAKKLNKNESYSSSLSSSIAILAILPVLLEATSFEQLDILQAKLLFGLFTGGFLLVFYHLLLHVARKKEGRWNTILIVKSVFVSIATIAVIGFMYQTKESVGGADTMILSLLAIALGAMFVALYSKEESISLKHMALGTVLIIIPFSGPTLEEQQEILLPVIVNSTENNSTPEKTVQLLDLSDLEGQYSMTQDSSSINFELGPKNSRTKGRIKKPQGKLILNNDISNSSLDVTIQVNELSTFNSIRDEHLMEEDYFAQVKFPEMEFKSESIIQNGNSYIAKGHFTMLGMKKELELTFSAIEYGDKIILQGSSQLDRTLFGMDPDPKIGDLVEFTFSALFTK